MYISYVYIYIGRQRERAFYRYVYANAHITSIRAFVKSRSGCPQPTGGYPREGQHQQGSQPEIFGQNILENLMKLKCSLFSITKEKL